MLIQPHDHRSELFDLAGLTVLVCGARVAGAACARVLLARGAHVSVADADRPVGSAELEAAGADYVGAVDAPPAGTQLVVASPGWRLDAPVFTAARAAGIEVIGEIELAWRLRRDRSAPWLGVTGTNGKTTTVRMVEAILRADGRRAVAVGNVGVPLVEAVTSGDYDVFAVELSSYQLAWTDGAVPFAAAAVLNLAPDHLDWHLTMEAYAAAKATIWSGSIAIGNADDPTVAALLASSAPARRVACTLGAPSHGQLGVDAGRLVDRAFDAGDLIGVEEVRPPGMHNVANALAASALALAAGVEPSSIGAGLRAFVPDPHRNAFVARVAGVDWVDDSKATNPHAAAAALNAYRPVVWIAGGQLKGVDIDELVASVAERLAGVVLLGVDRAQIAAALGRHAPDVPLIDVPSTDDGAMSAVVSVAASLARPGDTVLLSPAAASHDMFSSYAERGDRFATAVHVLAGPTGV